MLNKIKKGLAVSMAVAMMAVCFTGCGEEKLDSAETVAVVDGEEIPMGVAAMYTRNEQAKMYNMYTMYFGTASIFDQIYDQESMQTYGEMMKTDVMETLQKLYVLKAHAADYGVELTDEEAAEIDAAAKAFAEANADVLDDIGTSEEAVAELLSLYKYEAKMTEAMSADVDTNVTEEEAARSKVTYIRVSLEGTEKDADGNTIELTADQKKERADWAADVLDKVLAAEDPATADWDAIAKEVDESLFASEYTFSTYDEEDNVLDEAVKAEIKGLADGTVVDKVIVTSDEKTLYVVRFDAEVDEEATAKQKENIIATRKGEDFQAELEEWIAASAFSVVDAAWDKVSINDSNVYLNFHPEDAE